MSINTEQESKVIGFTKRYFKLNQVT